MKEKIVLDICFRLGNIMINSQGIFVLRVIHFLLMQYITPVKQELSNHLKLFINILFMKNIYIMWKLAN